MQLQVHHPRQRPDPLNRSNAKTFFRFFSQAAVEGQRPVFLFLQRWTVFVIETLSPQNFGNYFSVRITMYFSFLHSVQKQSHTFIGNSGKISHFPLDNPYFDAVKLYWKVREQVRRGALKCVRDCPSHNCNLFQTDVRMTTLVQRRERIMTIAILAHDSRKGLALQFCTASVVSCPGTLSLPPVPPAGC